MATSPSDRARPTPEELAAIVAAVEVAWPKLPKPPRPVRAPARTPAGWRFSGRWWAPDDALRRHG